MKMNMKKINEEVLYKYGGALAHTIKSSITGSFRNNVRIRPLKRYIRNIWATLLTTKNKMEGTPFMEGFRND